MFSCALCLVIGLLLGVLLPVDLRPEKPASVDSSTMTFPNLEPANSGSASASSSASPSQSDGTQTDPALDPAKNFPLLNTACAVNQALRQKDYAGLSKYIHPVSGVTFTPYSTVDLESDLSFTAAQIKDLRKDTAVYTWGFEDGRGDPIRMTMEQYFARYVYDTDYTQAPMIGVDRIITTGNALENITEAYPDCRFVDFCFPSADPVNDGLDWSSLKLVFQPYGESWYLVGIVHGEWTI